MAFSRRFISRANFELAFQRIVRGQNKEYKSFFRHLYPSYQLGLSANLDDLMKALKSGRYEPSTATCVYSPKQSGVLRPLRLLSLTDQVVYQATANAVADAFRVQQQKYAFSRSFGAIIGSSTSPYFYRSWRVCYRAFDRAIVEAFKKGNHIVADFDLVSFFELIDHTHLRTVLERKVKDRELLELLMSCLAKWAADAKGGALGHGIPQGPEASAFLAECVLFSFDSLRLKDVAYCRYVDDIKLLAHDERPVRRALLTLDLESKRIGLVPQAQKIGYRRVDDVRQLRKTVPSKLASVKTRARVTTASHTRLEKIFRSAVQGRLAKIDIVDATRFKFALGRMNRRTAVLRRIAPLLDRRPDLAWLFADYLKKFQGDKTAADVLMTAIRQDPAYDASAASYIDALDVCEPVDGVRPYRRVIQTAEGRSAERSIRLKVASCLFRGRRAGPTGALRLIERLRDPLAKSLVIQGLFVAGDAPYRIKSAQGSLQMATESPDDDLARFAGAILLHGWPWRTPSWRPGRGTNRAVKLLLKGVGIRARGPSRRGVLHVFFVERQGIATTLRWMSALGRDWREAERRCLRVQTLQTGDPTVHITMLDTFNELLLQRFSKRHHATSAAFASAAGPKAQPDLGAWLYHPVLAALLPKGIAWYRRVHQARVEGELAHARTRKGLHTKPISFKKREQLMRGAKVAWAELIAEWRKIL